MEFVGDWGGLVIEALVVEVDALIKPSLIDRWELNPDRLIQNVVILRLRGLIGLIEFRVEEILLTLPIRSLGYAITRRRFETFDFGGLWR